MMNNVNDGEDNDQPLDMSWPNTMKKQFFYLFTLPITLPLWLTLPDTRRKTSKVIIKKSF